MQVGAFKWIPCQDGAESSAPFRVVVGLLRMERNPAHEAKGRDKIPKLKALLDGIPPVDHPPAR